MKYYKSIIIVFFIGLLVFPAKTLAQKQDCKGQFNLAEDFFIEGNFLQAERLLEEYYECSRYRNSDYYKLKAELFIALDKINDAKLAIINYINSKVGNFISDNDPQLFKDLFYYVQDSLSENSITSLSKKPENIDLASATVIVIKESDFVKRGYNDLIALLADQPGFDISRTFSGKYAHVYQRGLREENTEKTLLMIDGIEENDVWSNVAYISLQYPLSNIRAIEIIYGPASTIYGPRAFSGAINIITKSGVQNSELSAKYFKEKKFKLGVTANISGASFSSQAAELNISGKNKDVSFIVTGREFSTNGIDLSGTSFFNYKTSDFDNLNYSSSKLLELSYNDNPLTKTDELNNSVNRLGLTPGSKNYNYFTGYGSGVLKINPIYVDSVISKAKQIDKERYLQTINGAPIGFSNRAKYYYIGGKIKFDHFEIGFRKWMNIENHGFYQDLFTAGSKNGSIWSPKKTILYSIYDRQFKRISFTNTSTFNIDALNKQSNLVSYNSYFGMLSTNPYGNMTIFNFLFPDSLIDNQKHGWKNEYFYYKALQFRNDFKMNYTFNGFSLLTGIDIRTSQMPGDYLTYQRYANAQEDDQSSNSFAEVFGTAANQTEGSNIYNIFDLGWYWQANISLVDSLFFITTGGRTDYNKIRTTGGFGVSNNPKIACVLTSKKIIVKAIFSQGIQNPSQYTKYSSEPTRIPNPNLLPERIQNFEFIIQNKHIDVLHWHLSTFYSLILDEISSIKDINNTSKSSNQNTGTYEIFGSEANIQFNPKKSNFSFSFNGTYTHGRQTIDKFHQLAKPLIIGDIAPIKANFIVNYHFGLKSNDFNFNLRSNYVSSKPVGPNTTVNNNRGVNETNSIPSFLIFHTSILYKNKNFDNGTIQFTINNILNTNYYSPGIRTAAGNSTDSYNGFAPYFPQPTRNFVITIGFKM